MSGGLPAKYPDFPPEQEGTRNFRDAAAGCLAPAVTHSPPLALKHLRHTRKRCEKATQRTAEVALPLAV